MTTRRRRWAVGTVLAGSLVAMSATADVATAAPDAPTPYQAPAVHATIQVSGALGNLAPASTQTTVVDLLAGAPAGATLILPTYKQGDTPMPLDSVPIWMAPDNPKNPDVFQYPTADHPGLTGVGIRPDLIQPSAQSSALCPGITATAAGEISSVTWCDDWARSGPQVHALAIPYGISVDGVTTASYVYVDVVVEPTLDVTDPATSVTSADVTVSAESTTDVTLTPPVAGATYEGFWLGATALDEVSNWNPVPAAIRTAIGHGDYESSLPARHLTVTQGSGATVTIGRDNAATGDHDIGIFGEWRMPDGSTAWTAESLLVTTPAYVAPVPTSAPSTGPAPAPTPSKKKAKPALSCSGLTPVIKPKEHGINAAVVKLKTKGSRLVPVSVGQLAKACSPAGSKVWVAVTFYVRSNTRRVRLAQHSHHSTTRPTVRLYRGHVSSAIFKHGTVRAVIKIRRAGTRHVDTVLTSRWTRLKASRR